MAGALYVNGSYLLRAFRKSTGFTPLAYHNHIRCRRAMELLTDPGMSASQIGEAVGFVSSAHFSHVFNRLRQYIDNRLNHVAQLHKLLLNTINTLQVNADRWQQRYAIVFFCANNDISSAPVVYVICKGANGMQNIFRIPAFLEIKTFPFNDLPTQKLFYING